MTSQPKEGVVLPPLRMISLEEVAQALAPFAFLSEVIDTTFLRFDQGLPPDSVLLTDLYQAFDQDGGSVSISMGSLRQARRVLEALRERQPR